MNTASESQKPQSAVEWEEEEVIELTEVLEEGAGEVVLELSSLEDELDILNLGGSSAGNSQTKETMPPPQEEESLDDFLTSLREEPEVQETAGLDSVEAPAESQADLRQAVLGQIDPELLRQIVREVVQETVERLGRELFPSLALEVVNREIDSLKKSITEDLE